MEKEERRKDVLDMSKHNPLLTRIANEAEIKLEQERDKLLSLRLIAFLDEDEENTRIIEQGLRVEQAKRKVFEACTNLNQ